MGVPSRPPAEEKRSFGVRTLLQRAQAGDDEAFAQHFQSHAQALWKTAMGCLRHDADAADVLQETAIKAWRAIPSFDGRSDVATWLTRILLNACFDELRSRRRLVPLPDQAMDDAPLSPREPSPDDEAASARLDVHAVIDRLPFNDRTILTLFYVNDLPIRQVAEVLGISEGAVRTRLTRARARFKELYARPCPEGRPSMEVAS